MEEVKNTWFIHGESGAIYCAINKCMENVWVLIVSSWFAISRRRSDTNLCASRIVKLEIREALVCLLALWERIEVRESVAEISPVEVKVKKCETR